MAKEVTIEERVAEYEAVLAQRKALGARFSHFPFFYQDFQTSPTTRRLTPEQKWWYIELLGYHWDAGSVPDDMTEVATILGLDPTQFEPVWPKIRAHFILHPEAPGQLLSPKQMDNLVDVWRSYMARRKGAATTNTKRAEQNAERPAERSGEQQDGKGAARINRSQFIYDLLPASHQTAEMLDALRGYIKMRVDYRYPAWKESTMREHAEAWGKLPHDVVVAGLTKSRESQWRGVFFDSAKRGGKTEGPGNVQDVRDYLMGDDNAEAA